MGCDRRLTGISVQVRRAAEKELQLVNAVADIQAASPAKTRIALLDAACSLLREGDTLDFSLSEIGKTAGISAALVKYYFGNKRGLLIALVDRDATSALAAFVSLLDEPMPAAKKLRYHITGVIKTYSRYPYLARLVNALIRDSHPAEAKELTDRFVKPMADAYDRLIKDGVAAGEFNPLDPMTFYFMVVGLTQDIFASRAVLKHCFGVDELTPAQINSFSEQACRVLLNGISAKMPQI